MGHPCGSCEGTGDCQNDYHDMLNNDLTHTINDMLGTDDRCPACGEEVEPGKCSVCGGSGEQDDDDHE